MLINRFDGLGIQIQMASNVFNGHDLAQFVDVARQPMRDPLTGIREAELLHLGFAACRSPYPAIRDVQKSLSGPDIQVSDKPSQTLGVNLRRLTTFPTNRPATTIGLQMNQRSGLGQVKMSLLVDDFHTCKWKIRCYTESGHHVAPFGLQALVDKALVYQKAT